MGEIYILDGNRWFRRCSCQFRVFLSPPLKWPLQGSRERQREGSWLRLLAKLTQGRYIGRIRFVQPRTQQFFRFSFFLPSCVYTPPLCSWEDLFWTQPTRLNTIENILPLHHFKLDWTMEKKKTTKNPQHLRHQGRRRRILVSALWYGSTSKELISLSRQIKEQEKNFRRRWEREREREKVWKAGRKKNSHNASFHRQVHSNLALRQGELYSSLIHIFVQVHAQVPAAAAAAASP